MRYTCTSKKDQRAVTRHKLEAWLVGNNPQADVQSGLPLAQHTCSFTATRCWNAPEGVALGAKPRELLKVRKILKNDSLLLASDWTTSRLIHQEEHSLAELVLARVDFLFAGKESAS